MFIKEGIRPLSYDQRVDIYVPSSLFRLGHDIDSGIDLSIKIDKLRVFINKTLSILSDYQ
jgi:hypothetical protein